MIYDNVVIFVLKHQTETSPLHIHQLSQACASFSTFCQWCWFWPFPGKQTVTWTVVYVLLDSITCPVGKINAKEVTNVAQKLSYTPGTNMTIRCALSKERVIATMTTNATDPFDVEKTTACIIGKVILVGKRRESLILIWHSLRCCRI